MYANATLTCRQAYQLVWNRTCSRNGGEGNNIPMDLENEHLNREFEEDIKTFRANISAKSISRSSQAIGPLMSIIKSCDKLLKVKSPRGTHTSPSVEEDL